MEVPLVTDDIPTFVVKDAPSQEQLNAILTNPNLFEMIANEFKREIVGEEQAIKAIFLSACSLLINPENAEDRIHTIVDAPPSGGKDFTCRNIVRVFPKNRVEHKTKVSANAFTYWHNSKFEPEWSWDNKLCYLSDPSDSLLESDVFKTMCTEGSSSAVVINQRTVEIEIIGKPVFLITTAQGRIKTEIEDRFNLIKLDESPEQTKRIHERQAERARSGKKTEYNHVLVRAVQQLNPVPVRVPYAEKLIDKIPADRVKMRRVFPRFLALIKASAALHQLQREKDEFGNVLANRQDYDLAQSVINHIGDTTILGLTNQLRQAYEACERLAKKRTQESIEPEWFDASDIATFAPKVGSLAQWYRYIDKLTAKGLLLVESRQPEGLRKKVRVYWPEAYQEFKLPSGEELGI